jgi:hypothetical protein
VIDEIVANRMRRDHFTRINLEKQYDTTIEPENNVFQKEN